MAEAKLKITIEGINKASKALKEATNELNKLKKSIKTKEPDSAGMPSLFKKISTGMTGIGAQFSILMHAAREVKIVFDATFGRLYKNVEEFNFSVVKAAALLGSFQETAQTPEGIAEGYKKAKDYAEALVWQLETLAPLTIASGKEMTLIAEEMFKQRVVLDTSNKEALTGFVNIANAASVVSQTANKEVQLRQEVRALMLGQLNMYSQLALQVDSMVGGTLRKKLEIWRAEGTVIQNIGKLLKGYEAASNDIQGTWMAISALMKTISDRTLRVGFSDAYTAINAQLRAMLANIMEQGPAISGGVYKAWAIVANILATIKPILENLKEPLKLLGTLAVAVTAPFALLSVYLPGAAKVITEVINLGLNKLNFIKAGYYYITKQQTKLDQVLAKAGKDMGKLFTTEFWEEIEKDQEMRMDRLAKLFTGLGPTSPPLVLGPPGLTDEQKDLYQAQMEGQTQIEIEALKARELAEQEALKTSEKLLTYKFKRGLILEGEYEKEIAVLKMQGYIVSTDYANKEIELLKKEFADSKSLFKDDTEATKKEATMKQAVLKIEGDILKTNEEMTRTGIDLAIKKIDITKELSEVYRGLTLKNLEEEINKQKELNQLKLYVGNITPLQAKTREIELEKQLGIARIASLQTKIEEEGYKEEDKLKFKNEILIIERQINNEQLNTLQLKEAERETLNIDLDKLINITELRLERVKLIGTLEEQIKLENELASLESERELLVKKISEEEKNAIKSTEAVRKAREEALKEPFGALKVGFRDILHEWENISKQMVDLSTTVAQDMSQVFSDIFFDAFEGRLKKARDYLRAFLISVRRALTDILAKQLVVNLFGSMMSRGASGGTASAPTSTSPFATYHEGGLLGSKGTKWGIAPRFHIGGLNSDEMNIVGQKGEYMVSRKGVDFLDRINTGQIPLGGQSMDMDKLVNTIGEKIASQQTVIINSLSENAFDSWATSLKGRKVIRNIVGR